jgi:outer membrane biogenesis lipoprotein LolB
VAPPLALPSAAQLQAVLAQHRLRVHSLRALAHIRYRDPQESNTSREAIVVARPDRLRVEVLSLFGSVFVLAADGGALTAYARQENTVYRGRASSENLWRYVGLTLPVHDLVELVLGTPPPRQAEKAHVSFDAASGSIRLQEDLARGTQLVWFSPAALLLGAEEQGTDGQTQWRATFGEYEDLNGFALATHIALEVPEWHRSVEIALEDIDLNPKLDPAVFAVQIPPGSKVVDLDAVAD